MSTVRNGEAMVDGSKMVETMKMFIGAKAAKRNNGFTGWFVSTRRNEKGG
jgi:hypothetical protein